MRTGGRVSLKTGKIKVKSLKTLRKQFSKTNDFFEIIIIEPLLRVKILLSLFFANDKNLKSKLGSIENLKW